MIPFDSPASIFPVNRLDHFHSGLSHREGLFRAFTTVYSPFQQRASASLRENGASYSVVSSRTFGPVSGSFSRPQAGMGGKGKEVTETGISLDLGSGADNAPHSSPEDQTELRDHPRMGEKDRVTKN